MQRRPQRVLAASAAALTALTMGACASSDRDSGGTSAEGGSGGGTFVFGAAGDPAMFDPAFATDGESFRVTRQIYEGLLTTRAGSADLEPALAEDYEVSEDGLEYTFALREGVTFHDGTDFNAEAVCFNFDRWYNFEGLAARPRASEYYQNVFGGFASTPDVPSLYESCEATDESTAVVRITQVTSRFPAALTLPSVRDAEPDGARGVRRRQPQRQRGRARATRPTPSSTRPAPAPSSSTAGTSGTARSPSSATRTTGATRPASTRSSSARSPTGTPVARSSRPARSTATTSSPRPTTPRSRTAASRSCRATRSTSSTWASTAATCPAPPPTRR